MPWDRGDEFSAAAAAVGHQRLNYGTECINFIHQTTPLSESAVFHAAADDFYRTTRLATGLFVYPAICLVGLTGNSMALVVLCRAPMRSTSYNVILAALAANDLIKLVNDLFYFVDVLLERVDRRAENVLFGHVYPVSHYIFNQV